MLKQLKLNSQKQTQKDGALTNLRECKSCGLEAYTRDDLELFVKDSKGRSLYGRKPKCKECSNIERLASKKKQGISHRKGQLMKAYGITPEEYEWAMSTSDCCEKCGKTYNLCYDHDHNVPKNIKAFRGILCSDCNAAIGKLGDTMEGLLEAINYLAKTDTKGWSID